MDTSEQTNLDEVISKLPQKVQDFIDNGLWEKITREIGRKYTLEDAQTENLVDDTLLLVAGLATPEQFIGYIKEDILVTEIVAEQVLEEINKRIVTPFSNIFQKETKVETITRSPIAKVIIREKSADFNKSPIAPESPFGKRNDPDRPVNLPVADEDKELVGQTVDIPRYVPTKIENLREEEAKKYEVLKSDTASKMYVARPEVSPGFTSPIGSKIVYKPVGSPLVKPDEIVQAPSQIPRLNFEADMLTEEGPASSQFSSPNIPQQQPVVAVPAPQPAAPSTPIVKQYSVDPYREPVE